MKNNDITASQISLPKGGGAIQGIGEKFLANEFTGTSSLSLPIFTSACRNFEPQLTAEYSSGSGNGVFGLGWSISIPNISRKTSKGIPQYQESDTFVISNAEDLVPVIDSNRSETINDVKYQVMAYRPRLEGLFAQIEQWVEEQNGDSYWRVIDTNNVTSIFGKTENARIIDPEKPERIFQWLLQETFDAKGNYIIYEYKSENTDNVANTISELNHTQTSNKYIKTIKYGNILPFQEEQATQQKWLFAVVFDYGEYKIDNPYTPVQTWTKRQDSFSTHHAGFEIRTHRLCQRILLFHHFSELDSQPVLVHATRFYYQESPTVTLLTKVESIGYRYENKQYKIKSLPPLEFQYTAFEPNKAQFEPMVGEKGEFLPGLNFPPDYQLIDLYGEGVPGILYSDGQTTLYREPLTEDNGKETVTVKYAHPNTLLSLPIQGQSKGINPQLMDITGDGHLALVVRQGGTTGYYEVNPDRSWQNHQTFPAFPTDFYNSDNYLVDVTGDGLADLLLVENDNIWVYPSLGKNGFAQPIIKKRENGLPFPKRGAKNQLLQFADIFGTGIQHLVRVTNGKVECWPNLGYGRFGKPILLENAPSFGEDLDASRLFLADIDGSGTTDLIYVYPERIEVYFNQSGNSFSDPLVVHLPSKWDLLNQIEFADVHGNGTTCLIFSENHPQPRHWCYDFSHQQKPYLLNETNNNLGAKSTIIYCSSTKFYLADKQRGIPWIVNLPFPVQVVEKTEIIDEISNSKLVSIYSYHHGFYDGIEREFRGFGMVERQDAETLPIAAKPTDVPPILTKTWYHTGAWQEEGLLSRQYEKEYFLGDKDAYELPDSNFDYQDYQKQYPNYQPDETAQREVHRSLKGAVLREEVYGLDGSDLQQNPYTVTETNYHIRLLQPQGENKYGVYVVHTRESLTYDYERNPLDPRIHHEFVLEVDEYGNVLRSCSVTYGRRVQAGALSEQLSLKVTLEEDSFINIPGKIPGDKTHLLGVPKENKTYEIKTLFLNQNQKYFTFAEIEEYFKPLEASLEQNLNSPDYRLLHWERYYYWNPEQNQLYPLGQVSSQALLARTEVAEFATQQIEQVFTEILTLDQLNSLLNKEGKYQKYSDNLFWWNQGLSESYLDGSQFYLPKATTDPYGNATTYEYDTYCLMTVKVKDALNNQTVVEKIDYHLLHPQKIRDINDNITEVLFDPLGMVVATSHYGQENGQDVGFMPLDGYQWTEKTDIDNHVLDPQIYLQKIIDDSKNYLPNVASYSHYNLSSWKEHQIPVHVVTLITEQYPSVADSPVQIHITYSDGFGREQQSTIKVEPGEANTIQADGTVTVVETSDRWLATGRKVYNNKGQPVKEYEPYYLDTYQYIDNPHLSKFGVSPTLFYDPLERLIRVDKPKGFFSKVEFTPWEERHYDENDTIKDSPYYKANDQNQPDPSSPYYNPNLTAEERAALEKAKVFYNTPEQKILDNLGRTIQDIQQKEDGNRLITDYEWDIQGNQLASADPRLSESGKENFRRIFGMTGQVLKTVSADAGIHWQLLNVVGNPIYTRDSRQFEVTTQYDALHRPIAVQVQGGDGATPLNQTVERMVYGDSIDLDSTLTEEESKKYNLRGQLYRHYDQGGKLENSAYNLSGLPLKSSRQLNKDYKQEVNWQVIDASKLQSTVYTATSEYDALGRVTASTNADGNVYKPTYYLSGRLNQIEVDGEVYVSSIDYNPKGQRGRIRYGNGVTTTYNYESTTFLLTQILTTRTSDSKKLQDLNYTYDPVGNITHISDCAWQTVFNANQEVNPESDYTYDALYRLMAATGREHPALSPQNEQRGDFDDSWVLPLQPLNNGQALQNYSQSFSYDDGGNLEQINHQGAKQWHRLMTISDSSNRAVDRDLTDKPGEVNAYFDGNGNQIKLGGLQEIIWNYRNNIAQVTVIKRETGNSDAEYYVYDGGGNRLRKVAESYGNGGTMLRVEETIYLGMLEIKRITQGDKVVEERHSLRVMDDERCVAMRVSWVQGNPPDGVKSPQIRYQLDNHLGSATMEVDRDGKLISYEEYFPYGETALVMGRSVSEVKLKQYRYSGKERDSVTGFYYYGARYYVPCLGRWMSADPAGTIDGLNLYAFVESNPINHTDIGGYAKENKNKNKKTTKNKKLTVNKNSSGFKFSGRPAFDSAAKKIKVKKGQDRRHVIGYDDVIKPSFEKIINLVIGKVGEAAFRKLQSKLYTKHKITRAPKESAAVEKHLIFGLTKLNSTPGNLNPEAADENQAIEHVRQQGLRINQKLGEAFSSTTPDTPTVKKILKEGFAISGGGTPITDFADKIRKITHERIDKATNVTQLVSVLNETIASTGIDLNKASGSKAQTAFALGYISKAQEAADIESQLTPEQRLEAVWKLREIPQ